MADALERLFASDSTSNPNYSVDEQMASISEDDFLEDMSEDSRAALMHSVQPQIQEVTLDNTENTKEDESVVYSEPEKSGDELSNNNSVEDDTKKKQKGRPKQSNESANKSNIFNPIMDQLALNLLLELQGKKYKLNSFDDNLMQILFDYMRSKF